MKDIKGHWELESENWTLGPVSGRLGLLPAYLVQRSKYISIFYFL